MAIERKLSKTSIFSAEVLREAPADLEVTGRSNKYRDLRKDLLEALHTEAWGVRIHISSEDPAELKRAVCNVINAGYKWESAIELGRTNGLAICARRQVSENKLSCTIDLYFKKKE